MTKDEDGCKFSVEYNKSLNKCAMSKPTVDLNIWCKGSKEEKKNCPLWN